MNNNNQNEISVQKIRRRNYDSMNKGTTNENVVGNRIIFAKSVNEEDNGIDGTAVAETRFELGHVAFWNRSLSTQEILNIYKRNIVRTRNKLECCAKKRDGLAGNYCIV